MNRSQVRERVASAFPFSDAELAAAAAERREPPILPDEAPIQTGHFSCHSCFVFFRSLWYFCSVPLFCFCTSRTHACLDWDYNEHVKRYSHDWPAPVTAPRRTMWQLYARYVNATSPESRGRLLVAVQDARRNACMSILPDADVSVH